ncbi:MAG: nitrite/sulfite reductase [Kiritimatiellia bacterium]|jgi:sulfite reductase beta subunit-like hemoprotein|nr:nitrite/sulfite reductase [Kiritimatiellia bacterium]MDP6630339.1 nitrite/sulfite reductase [Kiritimatiellia bacterium]MDP6810845.1 nitrite/sulfite reductase [Kiritimatiellia bacterium]MDP7024188.1 nitrite/sulfite reductase [Kiritimatiellia bacterium]
MPAAEELTAVEQDKLDIDPNFDFRDYTSVDFDDIPLNVMAMFKWAGVYSQLQKGFFMIRLVCPGGLMTTEQFSRALELADQYAQGELCITTRQTLQFHWVRLHDIHKVIEGMLEVGITTKNGCGDVTRNTVTCEMQGVCPHEVGDDVRRLIEAIANDPEIRDQQRNLPRKHKISVAGCGRACAATLINCQGWVPVTREAEDGSTELGWRFHAGGGLGSRPYLAKVVFDWVPCDLALDVARATVEAFRRHGDRRNRAFARLKIVVDRMGADAFGSLLLDILDERGIAGLERIIPAADPIPSIGPSFLSGQGALPQKEAGLHTVRVLIPRSEIPTATGREISRLAAHHGRGEIAFTGRQNIAIRHVPDADVAPLREALHKAGLQTEGFERGPDVVACVGTTQCRMAVSDTRNACLELKDMLQTDEAYWDRIGPLRIHFTGCPNNCAHAWSADIGLRGRRRRGEAGNVEGYSLFVGGKLSGAGNIAEHLVDVDSHQVNRTVRRILDLYLDSRQSDDEMFIAFIERVTLDTVRTTLFGPEVTHP